jgi:nicotinate-nucleotide adenylyltransferase
LKATVSDIELNREGKSYSVDTVLTIKKLYPNQKIAITIGADMLINFKKWFKYETILKNADIITFFRADSNKSSYEEAIKELKELGANIVCIDTAIDNISSTKIRELLKEGKSVNLYLDPDIKNYIIENQVYGEL